jgi:hypothetical protein
VHTNNLVINDGTTWKTVEGVAKLFPHFYREATTAFVIKTINTIDASALMISSQEKEILGVFNFVGKQQTYDL